VKKNEPEEILNTSSNHFGEKEEKNDVNFNSFMEKSTLNPKEDEKQITRYKIGPKY
jgi:hypothetical protein